MSSAEFPDFKRKPPVYVFEESTPDGVVVSLDTGGQIEETAPLSSGVVIAMKNGVWRKPEGGTYE
jgi:hypothetical protein